MPLHKKPVKLRKLKVGDDTNYTEITSSGRVKLHGSARLKKEVIMDPTRFKLPAANYPGQGTEGVYTTLDYDPNTIEKAYCVAQVPLCRAPNTPVEVEVHWFHDSADSGKVVWGLAYQSSKPGDSIPRTKGTIVQVSSGNHPAGKMVSTEFSSPIPGTVLVNGDLLGVRLFRKASSTLDTLSEDARTLSVCFHFTASLLGGTL